MRGAIAPERLAEIRAQVEATGVILSSSAARDLLAAHDCERERADRVTSVMASMAKAAQAVAVAAGWPEEQPIEDPSELVESVADLRRRAEQAESDLAAAAGELLVPLPDPGSDLAKVISANRLLRARVETAERDLRWERERCDTLERERNDALLEGANAAEVLQGRAEQAEAEVARLRARVRVEADDVERAGVTRAHVEAWLRGHEAWRRIDDGSYSSQSVWRRDGAGTVVASNVMRWRIQTIIDAARADGRPSLDILDEMAAMEVPQ